ncbi:MAG: hypothetical protein ACLPV8_23235 [Steroidobacteraceae bacterium]
MANRYRFYHRARVRASVAVAWDVFTDHERIGEFTNTPMRIIKPGSPDRNGLGCVRRMGVFDWQIDELVNIWRPHEVYGYHIIESSMIDAHQGVVRFFPTQEQGCEWVYDMQNIPNQKALDQASAAGVSYQVFLGTSFKEYMNDLEAECERRADQERVPASPPSTSTSALP